MSKSRVLLDYTGKDICDHIEGMGAGVTITSLVPTSHLRGNEHNGIDTADYVMLYEEAPRPTVVFDSLEQAAAHVEENIEPAPTVETDDRRDARRLQDKLANLADFLDALRDARNEAQIVALVEPLQCRQTNIPTRDELEALAAEPEPTVPQEVHIYDNRHSKYRAWEAWVDFGPAVSVGRGPNWPTATAHYLRNVGYAIEQLQQVQAALAAGDFTQIAGPAR